MPELSPIPFAALLRRLRNDMASGGPMLGMDRRHWYRPANGLDLSATHGARKAGNPLGPAAGPHTQLAQNMVLGWLGGARIFELKTLQVLDRLEIPRPCIHAPDLGFNVEWSQELRLEQSVLEYAKAAWLLQVLVSRHRELGLPDGDWLGWSLDLSVGYNLEGLCSPKMCDTLDALKHPRAAYDELRASVSGELLDWAGPPPEGPVADTITLSTFHGCPPAEIESMVRHLMETAGWNVVIKFNPTLLGEQELRERLHGTMGYDEFRLDPAGIARDLTIGDAIPMIKRLQSLATGLGLQLGGKFTNTLILKNDPGLFPRQRDEHMYLSGPPLHPLALATASMVANAIDEPLALSFSAGLDRKNLAATVACGFMPVTVCTELLKPGGYARLAPLVKALEKEMQLKDCISLQDLVGHDGHPDAGEWKLQCANLARYAESVAADERYRQPRVRKNRKVLDSVLDRYDCVNCDLCITVCPNNAFFSWETKVEADGPRKTHQLAFLADACNGCGNCELYCPEQGDPIKVKERIMLDPAQWNLDQDDAVLVLAERLRIRLEGQTIEVSRDEPEDNLPAELPLDLKRRIGRVLRGILDRDHQAASPYWPEGSDS